MSTDMFPADVFDDVLGRSLEVVDPQIAAALEAERVRQETTLEMIASENFAPVAVMQAQGSVATNKYAEGYPGRRYYGGCEHVVGDLFHDGVQPGVGQRLAGALLQGHAVRAPGTEHLTDSVIDFSSQGGRSRGLRRARR